MTPATIQEVDDFVGLVRLYLGDLDDEVRDELTDGLAADLTELVEERSGEALPDPEVYADELRAAAGLSRRPTPTRARPRRSPVIQGLQNRPDVDRVVGRLLDEVRDLGIVLQPVWWVLRGWVVVSWLDLATGREGRLTLWPMINTPVLGLLLVVAAIGLSVEVGRGRRWPGSSRSVPARTMMAFVNVLCLLMLCHLLDGIVHLASTTWM